MRKLHIEDKQIEPTLSPDLLKARLSREKLARQQAETLLEEKSRELYTTNKILQKVAEAVESQRVQLDTILDHTITGIVLAGEDLSITRANRKAIALFGLGEDYFAELSIRDLFEDFTPTQTLYEARIPVGPKTDDTLLECVGQKNDKTTFPMEFGLTCMEIDGKQHSVWIFRDITNRKRQEAKREALERELSQSQKMESLGTLASGIAHEINTPIQYISDNLRFLKDTISDLSKLLSICDAEELTAEKAQKIIQEFQNMAENIDLEFLLEEAPQSIDQSLDGIKQVAKIVNAVKEFSHPGEEETSKFDLNQLVETALTVTRNQWKYVTEVETDLLNDLPMIKGTPSDINQVLLNLIVNASDAISDTHPDGLGKIHIQTLKEDDHVTLRIQDNGCGMSDEVKERIFDPFFTTKSVGKGTGQGLAIAYTIIKQKHKGQLICESKKGEGTTFIIKLPINPDKEMEI